MSDRIIRAFLPEGKLQIIFVDATSVAHRGRELQKALPTAASLFAQTLTAGLLLGALQKGDSRLNLQIECDGPVRGIFADARPSGEVRGYIKNGLVDYPGQPVGPFRARGALGRRGFVSVLRDVNGEVYRGMVDLESQGGDCEIADLLHRYFDQSEQVETGIALSVSPRDGEPLGRVTGLLVQALPDGDRQRLRSAITDLRGGWLDRLGHGAEPLAALAALFAGEQPQLIDEHPALYRCTCSPERALRAITAMGREEIVDLWEKEGKAEATCEFCGQHYIITGEELLGLIFPGNTQRN